MALTDIQIKRTKPRTKPYKISDGGGLFLWVTPSGGRLWRWAFRFEGKAKLMTFGKYPDVSLSQARERHGEARKLLAAGTDPMAHRKAEKTADRVA
ncbi:MAG TPA: Arm DNA-binding domain-containing protein, partial [Acidobacteriaceae bacterium]|nr:Arm DNA-binding domain-containing protein [Acidobacteriaceae bacterium]